MNRTDDGWYWQIGPADADNTEFDIAYWQAQGPEAIFAAAWELVETAWKAKGLDPADLKLAKTCIVIKDGPG